METVINIRKRGMKGRGKKWPNLSYNHLIKMYSYGMLPGCLSYKSALCGHRDAEAREAKAEAGAGSVRQTQVLQGGRTEDSADKPCRARKEISGPTDEI